ncbi:MAG TPA: hypothetical protein VHD63_05100 [Ktedonobacteraceae bacterium]|nr:hypothetical protein [Ktedonobacteraceae bacterium]
MIQPQDTRHQAPPTSQQPQTPGKGPRKVSTQVKVVGALALIIFLVAAGFLFMENGNNPSNPTVNPTANSNVVTPVLSKPWCASPNELVNDFYGTSMSSLSTSDVWSAGSQIRHWDGKSWNTSYTPASQQSVLRGILEVAANDVWVVGEQQTNGMASHPLVLHWDGSNWKNVSAPDISTGGKNALVALSGTGSDNLWAVGFSVPLQGPMVPLIEHWNGSKWSVSHLSTSVSLQFTSVKALTANNVWAVGYEYGTRDGKNFVQPVTEHWNGSQWSSVTNPDLRAKGGGNLYSISGDSADDLWAVGSQNNGSAMLTEHWNGSKWSIVTSPAVAPGNSNWLASVAVSSPNNVWAVGRVASSQGGFDPFVLHWDGQQWQVLSDPTSNAGELDIVSFVGSQVWIVGLPKTSGGHAFIETLCP